MGETNDLTKKMPEKTAEMVQQLDAYLQKVGAWTMEEVYATRLEELEKWILKNQLKVDQLNQQLNETGLSQEDRLGIHKKLKESTTKIKHCRKIVTNCIWTKNLISGSERGQSYQTTQA